MSKNIICEFCGKIFHKECALSVHKIYCNKNNKIIKQKIKISSLNPQQKLEKRLIELKKHKNINYIKYRIENYNIFFTYKCEKCGTIFETDKVLRRNRKVHCINCKRKVLHKQDIQNINSIFELSSRTREKIIKRMNLSCYICGWNQSTLDAHHIIHKSQNGGNECSNIIYICPNCHRIIHTTNKYSIDYLKKICQEKIKYFEENWKKYYGEFYKNNI